VQIAQLLDEFRIACARHFGEIVYGVEFRRAKMFGITVWVVPESVDGRLRGLVAFDGLRKGGGCLVPPYASSAPWLTATSAPR
jgi:hypothetical protein